MRSGEVGICTSAAANRTPSPACSRVENAKNMTMDTMKNATMDSTMDTVTSGTARWRIALEDNAIAGQWWNGERCEGRRDAWQGRN